MIISMSWTAKKVKTSPIGVGEMLQAFSSLHSLELKVYGYLTYALACRAGELLPYPHYKTVYEKLENGKYKAMSKQFVSYSLGVSVASISYLDLNGKVIDGSNKDLVLAIRFDKIPVFKQPENTTKTGFVFRKGNPFFPFILNYVESRKVVQVATKGKLVYLFAPTEEIDLGGYFYRFKRRFERAMKKVLPEFHVHQLRVTRASVAGDLSGNPFYVQELTGHANILQAAAYTKSKGLYDKIKKYEGE
jgi:hypothetical protein